MHLFISETRVIEHMSMVSFRTLGGGGGGGGDISCLICFRWVNFIDYTLDITFRDRVK